VLTKLLEEVTVSLEISFYKAAETELEKVIDPLG